MPMPGNDDGMDSARKNDSERVPGEEGELRAFMTWYGLSFISADLAALSSRFSYPCHVAGDTGDASAPSLHVVADRVGLANLLQPVIRAYHQLGVARAEITDFSVTAISPRLRSVTARWQLRDGQGRAIYAFSAAYTIAGGLQELAIVAIAHDEMIHARDRLRKAM